MQPTTAKFSQKKTFNSKCYFIYFNISFYNISSIKKFILIFKILK